MSSKIFEKVKVDKPSRTMFDLTHDVKLSCKMGQLVPIMMEPVLPGDNFKIGCDSLLRFSPLIAPIMHRVNVFMHYFFVPNRILWDNWEKYITNTKDPLTQALPPHPSITILANGNNYNKLFDYAGIPNPVQSTQQSDIDISPMALAAYNCICNEYYRDQNLMDEIPYKLVDGDNGAMIPDFILRNRCWEHDYLTSALPFAQKGDPVEIPMSGLVELDPATTAPVKIVDPVNNPYPNSSLQTNLFGDMFASPAGTPSVVRIDPQGTLVVNQGTATLNDLRIAMRVQEWLEKAARGGSRYTEQNRVHFAVKSSDARLQRPEFITGTMSPVVISEVLNTAGNTTPQGTMSGHGYSVTSGKYGSYFAEEHGYIIGIMSVMPKTAYQQGMPRHFLKIGSPLDSYAFPVFANLGEQEILKAEVMAYTSQQYQVFGYIPRYSEYKYANNRVAGDFRTTLNFWHMGRIFDPTNIPVLNEGFVISDPTDRCFAIEDETDNLWVQVLNKVTAVRALPYFGTPTF